MEELFFLLKTFNSQEKIENGIKSSIDFLKKELHIHSLNYLPYPAMLVSLVKFFGSDRKSGASFCDEQRKQLIRWFWRSCFSRRYSSGVNSAHETDLLAMEKLIDNKNYNISSFKCEIPDYFFTDNIFNITSVNTKTYIAMLASKYPKSFISGANVDLSKTLQTASAKEFHHIFPDKFLQRQGKKESRYIS